MVNHKNENLEEKFRHLFEIITNKSFLNRQAIIGEVPFFISTFNPANQLKVEKHIDMLIKRLQTNGIETLKINLYDLCIKLLQKNQFLDKLLEKEKSLSKTRFFEQLKSLLDIETKIVPNIKQLLDINESNVIFITGVGLVFPYLRLHKILNNLQSVIKNIPVVIFFPGVYDNNSLNLFGKFNGDNYYRAFNIDKINLKKEM